MPITALITGIHSVLGSPMRQLLDKHGANVLAWDRQQASPDNPQAIQAFLQSARPDRVFHFAVGPSAWAEELARWCGQENAPFVFTSSVSVFAGSQPGPFHPASIPLAEDDYGRYKRQCEQAILAANPGARVARIGWQIGAGPGSNNMVDYLEKTHQQRDSIPASIHWVQACSFVEDTATGLFQLSETFPGGIYHLDSNPGLNFFEIVRGLNRLHGNRWNVEATTEPRLDNRLLDERIQLKPLSERLQAGL